MMHLEPLEIFSKINFFYKKNHLEPLQSPWKNTRNNALTIGGTCLPLDILAFSQPKRWLGLRDCSCRAALSLSLSLSNNFLGYNSLCFIYSLTIVDKACFFPYTSILGIWILKTNMENKYRVLMSCLKNDIKFALGKFTISLI